MKSGAQGLIGAVASQTTSCYRTCLSLVSLTLTTSCSQPVTLPASLGMVLGELVPLECCLPIETREDNFTIRSSLYFSRGRCFGNLFSLTLFTMADVLISPWPAILCARNWHSSLTELLHLLPSLPAPAASGTWTLGATLEGGSSPSAEQVAQRGATSPRAASHLLHSFQRVFTPSSLLPSLPFSGGGGEFSLFLDLFGYFSGNLRDRERKTLRLQAPSGNKNTPQENLR